MALHCVGMPHVSVCLTREGRACTLDIREHMSDLLDDDLKVSHIGDFTLKAPSNETFHM